MRTQVMQDFSDIWLPLPRKIELSEQLSQVDTTHTPRKVASLVQRVRELVNSAPMLKGSDLLLALISIQQASYLADFKNCSEEIIFYLSDAENILATPFADSLDAIWQNRVTQ